MSVKRERVKRPEEEVTMCWAGSFLEEMSKQSQECVKSDQPWQDVVASIFSRQ